MVEMVEMGKMERGRTRERPRQGIPPRKPGDEKRMNAERSKMRHTAEQCDEETDAGASKTGHPPAGAGGREGRISRQDGGVT